MTVRDESARYYDLQDFPIDDVPFYEARVRPNDRVLELGCGTGRVLVPLARRCAFIHGVDASEAMLAICREKLVATGGSPPDPQSLGSPPTRAAPRGGSANPTRRDPRPSQSRTPVPREHALDRDRERLSWRLTCADITALDLGETFDLMIAPFRVLQNLETDAQLEGLMTTIERHLAPAGRAILNAFRPYKPAAEAVATWCEPGEILDFEKELPGGGRLVRTHRRPRLQERPLVVYPEIVYRRYGEDGARVHEAELKIAMRFWYPDQLDALVTAHGYRVTSRWGGYAGEPWGDGNELVIEFERSGQKTSP